MEKNLFSIHFAHINSSPFIMLRPESPCQPFFWEFIILLTFELEASKKGK
jgi:hypothetical protein